MDDSVKGDPMTVNRMEMPKILPCAARVHQLLPKPGNGCPALGHSGNAGALVGNSRSHLKMNRVLEDHEGPWHQIRPGWPYQAAGAEVAPCGPPRTWPQGWAWGPGAWWQLPDPSLKIPVHCCRWPCDNVLTLGRANFEGHLDYCFRLS